MTLPPDVLQTLQIAQNALGSEIRAVGRGASIVASEGVRVRVTPHGFAYKFSIESAPGTVAEGPAKIQSGEIGSKGSVDRFEGHFVYVTSVRDLGARPGRTVIQPDVAFLLEQLRDRLRAQENGTAAFNVQIVREALGFEVPCDVVAAVTIPTDLNAEQAEFSRSAATRSTSFGQGPPGTGKTRTAGSIVAEQARAGERVLVVGPTNVSVDLVVKELLGRVSPRQLGSPYSILRVGPADLPEELEHQVSARLLAERHLPEAARPSELRRLRELALSPIDAIEVLRAQGNGLLRDAPERDVEGCRLAVEAAAQVLAQAAAAADAAIGDHGECTHGDDVGVRERSDGNEWSRRRPVRSMFQDLLEGLATEESPRVDQLRAAVVRLLTAVRLIDDVVDRLKLAVDAIEKKLIGEARIVAATTTKAYLTEPIIDGQFDLVLIDEASMVNLAQLCVVAGRAKRAVFVVGDFRQLGPIAETREREARAFLELDPFVQAGIVAAVDEGRDEPRLVRLTRQYRMHPDICAAPSKLSYGGTLVTDRQVHKRSVRPLPFLRTRRRVGVVNTAALTPWAVKPIGTHSRMNPFHVAVTAATVVHLIDTGYSPKEIGVVTPYRGHARLLRHALDGFELSDVLVGTVHRLQGAERDAIVLDLPDSPPSRVSRMLKSQQDVSDDTVRRVLNVSVTRARETLAVVANWLYLKKACPENTPLGRLLREPGFGAPFTSAEGLVSSSRLAGAVEIRSPEDAAWLPVAEADTGTTTLVVGRADTLGLLRVLRALGAAAPVRIVYRAEGAIGAANMQAVAGALEGTKMNVMAVGLRWILAQVIEGRVTFNQIRDVDIKDLLGREQVALDEAKIREYLAGPLVLVPMGAGFDRACRCRPARSSPPTGRTDIATDLAVTVRL